VQRGGLFTGTKKYTYSDYIATAASIYDGPPSSRSEIDPVSGGGKSTESKPSVSVKSQGKVQSSASLSLPSSDQFSSSGASASSPKKPPALYLLLLAPLLYYVAPSTYRSLGFVFGVLLSVRYLIRQHLGEVKDVNTNCLSEVASGRMVIRFPVDLSKVCRYEFFMYLIFILVV
jgi:hypothetical protein